jgi:hypothetical protein
MVSHESFLKVPPGGCERGRWGERRLSKQHAAIEFMVAEKETRNTYLHCMEILLMILEHWAK